jgi:WD40 repeat protein/DNA-binding SARP family transcriptional activator
MARSFGRTVTSVPDPPIIMVMARGEPAAARFEFGLLGPLEVLRDGEPLKVSGQRQRALLSLLLVHANAFVPADRIIDELALADPSGTGVNALQATISRLRRLLGGTGVLVTERGGYALRADADQVDVARFERLASEGRRALAAGQPATAAAKLRQGLGLWRGPALADVADLGFAQAEVRRLEETRQSAVADRIEADLALGQGGELVGELEVLVRADPLQERLRGQLMLALYRAGRQADALEAYRQARKHLQEELGLEPSRALQQLERAILLQDASLEPVPHRPADVAGEPRGVQLCPFKGLAPFDVADAAYFFGRERLVADLYSRVVDSALVGIIGPSGSGKSSILRAGLLAALAAGALPGSDGWRAVLLRPGEHPSGELRRSLGGQSVPQAVTGLSPGQRLVLAVDQLEELFTICAGEAERTAFVASLTEAALDPERRVVVGVSLRADFYGRCAAYPEFAGLLSRNHVLVGAMERDELSRAIEVPAERAGLRVERPLTEALVADIVSEPGGLPLLSATLLELWRLRHGSLLQLEGYRRSGGVRGAVARLAEDVYRRLSEQDQALTRAIMLRLAAGDQAAVVRRRLPAAEAGRTEGEARVLAELIRARLLTVDDGAVEVAHEALLREWPRFTGWLQESREERRFRAHLADSAREWAARGRDRAELYRGARLAGALDWSAGHAGELDELEREFLGASRAESERELRRQRRQNRRLRALLAGAGVLLVLALIAGALALIARSNANHSATVALANSLGAQAIADPNLDQAMLLGVEGVRLDPSERTEGDLLTALLRAPAAIRTYHASGLRVGGLALSPDGRTLAFEDNFPSIFFLDTATGRRIREIPNLATGPVPLAYAPDGRLVLFGGANPPDEVDFRDPSTGRIVRRLPFPAHVRAAIGPFQPGQGWANFGGNNYAFTDGGHRLAVEIGGYMLQWALPQGRLQATPVSLPGNAGLVFYTAGGRRLIDVGTQRTVVLDTSTGRVVRSYRVGGSVAALSPAGTTMVFGDAAGSVRFLDLSTGTVTQSVSAHQGGVQAAGFTPGGKTAITSGGDGKSRVWDVATHQVVRTFAGHAGAIWAQAISADGSTLYTGSDDGTAIAWDLSGKRSFGTTFRAAASNPAVGVWNVALSPDGRMLAAGATGGTVNLWDARSLRKIESFRAVPGVVTAVSFGTGGRSLLVAGDSSTQPGSGVHGYLRIWRLYPRPRLLRVLPGLPYFITWATVSPEGKTVAATGATPSNPASLAHGTHGDGLVAEWNAATGTLLARPTLLHGGGPANDVAFAARGTTVVVTQLGNKAALADPARRKILARWNGLPTAEFMLGAALSPDGKRVATADLEGYLRVLDAATGKPVLPAIRASGNYVDSVNWSPDGARLVTAGNDGTVRLYDAGSGQQIGTSLPVGSDYPYATFSREGRMLVATDATGQVWLYPATAAGWETYACRLANRELTRSEWSTFVPGHPYHQVCKH